MKRFRMAGRTSRVSILVALSSAALMLSAASGFGATPSTPYRTVATDTPTVVNPATDRLNAQFGTRLTASKDSTGDGVPDIFIGSYSQDVNPALVSGGVPGAGGAADNNSGEITLINGATQQVVWHVTPEPQADPSFGIGFYVSAAGDVNGDGLEDVIASQPRRDIGGNVSQGRLYVLNGKTGTVIRAIEDPAPQANGEFAARLGTAGDVTGDKVPDMLVGAQGHDFPAGCGNETPVPTGCRKDEGETYIFNGATGGLVRTLNLPAEDRTGCSATGRCSFGGTVQSPGDVNKDGFPDQTVSAYAWSPPGSGKSFVGRMYLFSGGGATAGQVLAKIDSPDEVNGGFFGLEDPDRNAPGDLNADGTRDLYFSAFNAGSTPSAGGHSGAGRAFTFDGARTLATGKGQVLYELIDPNAGENRAFGWANSQTDYNKDGRPDLFVSNLATRNTTVSVFDGRNGSELKRFNTPAADVAADPNGAIGWSSRAPGDLNGDCEPDYVAGAPYQDVSGRSDQGRVYFFLSNGPSACPAVNQPAPTTQAPTTQAPTTQAAPAAFPGCPTLTANVIRGASAGNKITGTPRADRIFGGTGDDVVDALAGNDCVDLGTGNDRGQGGLGSDLMLSGRGDDRVSGSSGNDRINGNPGDDRLNGGRGNDRVFGDSGNDVLLGSFGNDVLHGVSGKDVISGSRGRDRINGGSGNDSISGGSSGDRISGDAGSDRINGNSGADRIKGNSGNDRITSLDNQRDRVNCGSGRDSVLADRKDIVARNCERVRRR